MNKIYEATKEFLRQDIPVFSAGVTLAVNVKVKEVKRNDYSFLKVQL